MSTEELREKGKQSPSAICQEARSLLTEFGNAVHQVVLLHERQYLAIVESDPNAGRFDLLIHHALEHKQNTKYAYLNHLDVHGCLNEHAESYPYGT
jgi:hypothetical protein